MQLSGILHLSVSLNAFFCRPRKYPAGANLNTYSPRGADQFVSFSALLKGGGGESKLSQLRATCSIPTSSVTVGQIPLYLSFLK